MNTLSERVKPNSKMYRDIIRAMETGRPWRKNRLNYQPYSARRDGDHVVILMRRVDDHLD